MRQDYDSNFVRQMQAASARTRPLPDAPLIVHSNPDLPPDPRPDPTREIRGKQANLCEAVMMRVVQLENITKLGHLPCEAKAEIVIRRLRAAVVANT